MPTAFKPESSRHFRPACCKRVTLLHMQDKTKIERHLRGRLDEFKRIYRARLE